MKINVHIERLILEGLPVSRHDGPRVRAAVTAELERLIAARGISEELQRGGAVPAVRAGTLRSETRTTSSQLGTQIARAVYGGLGRPE
jgi:hypothetical protein